MNLKDFDYFLPKELIAQKPLSKRDGSKFMAVSKGKIEHKKFKDIINYFLKGDVLVINDTKVFPAKLIGKKETGGIVRILLLKQIDNLVWECMAQGKNLDNKKIIFKNNIYGIIKKNIGNSGNGKILIVFSKKINALLGKIGKTPWPPYIKSDAGIKR